MTGWLIAILTALGALLLGLVKADLEDADVCRWLARKLIYRAALHLPRGERARWREESIRDVLDLPGRLPPVLWALDIYVKSGSWGRMLGEPSRWQMLKERIRVTLARRRARRAARELLGSMQRHPANNRTTVPTLRIQAESAHARAVGQLAEARYPSWITIPEGRPSLLDICKRDVAPYERGMLHLSDEEFVEWLAQERQDFHDKVDRRYDRYESRRRSRLPRLPS